MATFYVHVKVYRDVSYVKREVVIRHKASRTCGEEHKPVILREPHMMNLSSVLSFDSYEARKSDECKVVCWLALELLAGLASPRFTHLLSITHRDKHPSHSSRQDVVCGECCACSSCPRNFVEKTGTPEVLDCETGTNHRAAVPVKEKLAVTLRFLASGDSYTSLGYLFKMSKSTISLCQKNILYMDITMLFFRLPSTTEECEHHADEYNHQWNFPHCIGIMDGKHVMLQAPINTDSDYFNYKGFFFSIVLLAVLDTNYCFMCVSVGCQGRLSDGGVFDHKTLTNSCLPCKNFPVPYILLANYSLPLRPSIMKPFPRAHDKGSNERIYNYRHCRARRMVEDVFLTVQVVSRGLRKPLLLEPENDERVVKTCVHLYNFLHCSQSQSASYAPLETFDFQDIATKTLVPGQWRVDGMPTGTMLRLKGVPKKPSTLAKEIREEFSGYFTSTEGGECGQDKRRMRDACAECERSSARPTTPR
ncbi:hypothetical protein PR048_004915 [Dryococelus australis]|uniref:DDE Tnp4 domain-containing protein n=1 Tax=Dryococelus australis TaxID=614101 RepID=A0ABQ9I6R5_9NEOP|nr:hypothetical protein PR048_004915 [Dryococelus australis]